MTAVPPTPAREQKLTEKAISPLIGITIQKIKQQTQGMPITSV